MRRGGDIPFPSILLTRLLRQCLPVRKSVRPSIGVRGAPANFGTFPKTADEVDVLRTVTYDNKMAKSSSPQIMLKTLP